MADFPTAIFTPRAVANLPGIVYNADDDLTYYAEDYELPTDEIVAIETVLGLNPQGAYNNVAERLDALPSGAGGGLAAAWLLS